MRVIIEGIEQNYKVTSHIIEANHDNPDMFSLFHCWRCGGKLFQFSGDYIMSFPGAGGSQNRLFVPILHLCRWCKQRHLINSIL